MLNGEKLNSLVNIRLRNSMRLTILGITMILGNRLHSQRYFSGRNEWGVIGGFSNYYGDLSAGSRLGTNLGHFHPSFGGFYKYNFSSHFSLRNQVAYMKISGNSAGVSGRGFQNLTFQSEIYEFAPLIEFNFHPFGTNLRDGMVTPYVLTGPSIFYFNPTRIENEDIHLRNLNTEARRKPYSLVQPSIPLGFGVKTMTPPQRGKGSLIVGLEIVWRKTFTDYLDDVSTSYGDFNTMKENQGLASAENGQAQVLNGGKQVSAGTMRGDTHLKDWYYFVGLSLSYRFTPLICR